MENIRCEMLTDSNSELWNKYFGLSQEISRKHYSSGYMPGKTVQKFKEQILNNSVNLSLHRDFVVFENDKPAAWFDLSNVESDLYFGFDVLHDEVPENIMRTLLTRLYAELKESGFKYAVNYTFREPMIDAFKRTGAEINEEMQISRLERKDMDVSYFKKITDNEELNKLRLEFYEEIPDVLLNRFIEFSQSMISEIGVLNPYEPKMYPLTAESWKKNLKNFGNKVIAVFLFGDEKEIAGLSWVISYPESISTVQHNGGLTAVAPKYRGKGIAKYLKAKIYLKLLEENKEFKYITTDTMTWNKYMYRINEDLGFKSYRKGCSFKLTADFLKNYLGR